MNITHAASIIFYEIYKNTQKTYPIDDMDIADYEDKQVLNQAIDEITQKLDYPDYKQKQVNILAKRIIGRAFITGRELRTMRGLLNRINKRIENKQEE